MNWLFHIGIQGKHFQNGIQKFGYAMTVCAYDYGIPAHRGNREVAVSNDQTITMPHLAENLQEFRG